MVNRRSFIKTTTAAAIATSVMPHWAFTSNQKTGLALYTVREDMGKDAVGTLKKVAEIGYDWLETASYTEGGFYGMAAEEIRQLSSDMGMQLISAHISVRPENVASIARDCQKAGMKYLVIPWISSDYYSNTKARHKTAEMLNECGRLCREEGIRFAYHNHAFEFTGEEGERFYDILLQETDVKRVFFEPDIYWMVKAGVKPEDYFATYPGRFPVWHLKDMDAEGGFAAIGEGKIDFVSLFKSARIAGMQYHLVEQDRCTRHSPLESAAVSQACLTGRIL